MMSPENMAMELVIKEETEVADDQKVVPEQDIKCPRCDSSNTKFCYYNNYSLSQPRHYCKTCRRFWTKGGALRDIPVGGRCRKSKKVKAPAKIARMGGLKLVNGLSPRMDFHLAGLYNQRPLGSTSSPAMGFNYSLPAEIYGGQFRYGIAAMNYNSLNLQTRFASSIESLSSIKQDLHWKLQQQTLYGRLSTAQNLHPMFYQNLDLSEAAQIGTSGNGRKEGVARGEWLFGTSYAAANGGGAAIKDPGRSSWTEIYAWNNKHLSSHGRLP